MLKTILLATLFSFPAENDTIPLVDSNKILEQIQTFNENEEYAKSIDLLHSVSKYDSNYLEVQIALIRAYSSNNELSQAQKIGEELSKRTDLTANYYVTLGNTYLNNNLTDKGIDTYKKGLLEFPYNPSLLYNIGYAEYSRKNFETAIPGSAHYVTQELVCLTEVGIYFKGFLEIRYSCFKTFYSNANVLYM
jgi:tetratricopeptide (TPR) repeat protein